MAKGIVRKIDELGRVVVPIEIRRTTGIDVLMLTDLTINNGVLQLTRGNGRRIDELGRYVIPKEIRRRNGWDTGQEMEVYAENGAICIKKRGCEWCDETEDLIVINGHHLCISCTAAVTAAIANALEV